MSWVSLFQAMVCDNIIKLTNLRILQFLRPRNPTSRIVYLSITDKGTICRHIRYMDKKAVAKTVQCTKRYHPQEPNSNSGDISRSDEKEMITKKRRGK